MKTITIRINEESIPAEVMQKRQTNTFINNMLDVMPYIRKEADIQVNKMFNENEWMAFYDSLNSTGVEGYFRCSAAALLANMEDYYKYEATSAAQWKLNKEDFLNKIKALNCAQVEAIYRKEDAYWKKDMDSDDE